MKNSLLLLAIASLLLAAHVLIASETKTEDYDEDTYGPEAPIIWEKPVRGVTFSHKVHTMDNELDCDSCHDDTFEMEAGVAAEEDDFTMEALYEGKYCGVCHDGSTAFASDKRCTLCHIGVRGVERLTGKGDSSKAH